MFRLLDPTFWFYLLMAAAWLYRARRALASARHIPKISPVPAAGISSQALVTVIIPAKNEEKNIQECVENFLHQDYPNLQILIVNDRSTDKTETILKNMNIPEIPMDGYGIQRPAIPKISYLNASPTPPGWTGKNFAIHCAIPSARGKWFLFTDADTRHQPQSVSSSLSHALHRQLRLLTLLPKCLTHSFSEHMIQPSAMAYLGLWFPMEKVNNPNDPAVFGNGQYLLMERTLYETIGGHEKVRGEFLEDYAFMREAKKLRAKAECALGVSIFGTRMYESINGMWRGWCRIYLHAFEQKPGRLLHKYFNVLVFSVLPFACFPALIQKAMQNPDAYVFSLGTASVTLLFIIGTAWKAYDLIRAKRIFALLHPFAAIFISMFLLDAFWMAFRKSPTKWR